MTFRNSLCSSLTLAMLFGIVGCDVKSSKDKVVLKGTRLSVGDRSSPVIANGSSRVITLPSPEKIGAWDQVGGGALHVAPHSTLGDSLKMAWRKDIGAGNSTYASLTSGPVASDGIVYAMDADMIVTAVDSKTGKKIWSQDVSADDEDGDAFGGGVGVYGAHLFCTTAHGELLKLDSKTGAIEWRAPLRSPSRTAPTIWDDRIFVLTITNDVQVFSTDGGEVWAHDGAETAAGILGGAPPAVDDHTAVLAFASGEVVALRSDNGHPFWTESLLSRPRFDSLAMLAHVCAAPVIDQGIVYVVSYGGQMTALNLSSGQRLWTKSLGASQSPTVVGDFVFVLTTEQTLVCLDRKSGDVLWIKDLNALKEIKPAGQPEKQHRWSGPLVAGGRLFVTGSQGMLLGLSPQDGHLVTILNVGQGVTLSPIVVDDTLIVLTENGDLVAYK